MQITCYCCTLIVVLLINQPSINISQFGAGVHPDMHMASRATRCAYTAHPIVCFSEYISKRCSKARAVHSCFASVLFLRPSALRERTAQCTQKVRHHPVYALKSGCCLRSAQTRAPARGLRQLAAAFAAKPPMLSALVPGVTAAPAMRERCVRACWACALLIPTSRACPCCHRCQR